METLFKMLRPEAYTSGNYRDLKIKCFVKRLEQKINWIQTIKYL
jgi:hypothetical protein